MLYFTKKLFVIIGLLNLMLLIVVGCSLEKTVNRVEQAEINETQSPDQEINTPVEGLIEEEQLTSVLAEIMTNESIKAYSDALELIGYQARSELAFAGQAEGIVGVIIPFSGQDDDHHAVIRVVIENDTIMADLTLISRVESDLEGRAYVLDEKGQLVPAGTIAWSWWSCFWQCVLSNCGGGAIGCIYAGPLWWPCVSSICGFSAWYCAFIQCSP